jgi:1-acyl-sn-glycerol-3-phosphate acyltransferase
MIDQARRVQTMGNLQLPASIALQSARFARALLAMHLFAILAGLWLIFPQTLGRKFPFIAFSVLLWGFGIRVGRCGVLSKEGDLFVSNHVSWTDIPVLGVTIGAGFVAKSDIEKWPFLGRLTERYGCLFVSREQRATVRVQADALKRNIILFPEGTTGNGQQLLPFRSSLIGAVANGRGRIVPITLAYRWANGAPLGTAGWDMFAWVGDADLLTHAMRLALAPPIYVEVNIGDPIESHCRKQLALDAYNAISRTLASSEHP